MTSLLPSFLYDIDWFSNRRIRFYAAGWIIGGGSQDNFFFLLDEKVSYKQSRLVLDALLVYSSLVHVVFIILLIGIDNPKNTTTTTRTFFRKLGFLCFGETRIIWRPMYIYNLSSMWSGADDRVQTTGMTLTTQRWAEHRKLAASSSECGVRLVSVRLQVGRGAGWRRWRRWVRWLAILC